MPQLVRQNDQMGIYRRHVKGFHKNSGRVKVWVHIMFSGPYLGSDESGFRLCKSHLNLKILMKVH